jgi:hypothetical protein
MDTIDVVNGTRFPLDPRRISTDPAFVDTLAQATICYRSPGCAVTFTARPERPTYRSLPVRQ